jgi:hypothetical protein
MVCLADWRVQLMSDEVDVENPLGGGGSILVHRRWVFEFGDDVGGFATGEFLLRSDGVLFIRYGGDTWSSGSTTYRYSLWNEDPRWSGTSIEGFVEWATRYPYGLHPPSPVRVDETESGPISGDF